MFLPQTTTPKPADRPEAVITVALFAALLLFSLWAFRVGWESQSLPGHEFRQTQTALGAYFIQQEHNFSLAYPVPVMGKPWSVPMEFPLYQWAAVGVSNATGLELTKAGRIVGIVCFYLTLPCLYFLLGRLGLSWTRRLVALGLVLSCPLYLFWSRSFLIESMALFFAVAFLWSYLNAIERRHAGWWLMASIAGMAAGLVKVTTFVVVLLPAFGWTVVWLWQLRPGAAGGRWGGVIRLAGWALAAVALPCLAAWWWVGYADAIKAQNPMAEFLVSNHLQGYHFGSSETRFSVELWQRHFSIIFREIAAWWVLAGAGVLGFCFARRWWGWIFLLLGVFFAVQLIFPELYARHEYYYVANAFALMLAVGLVLCGVLESRLPRFVAWSLVLAVVAGQGWRYSTTHYPVQRDPGNNGNRLTHTLRQVTKPDAFLVVAGHDWSSFTPYFAQRRALMLRSGTEYDPAFLARSFAQLHGEPVGAAVLHGVQRENHALIEHLVREFDLEPRPAFTCGDATVYLPRRLWFAGIHLIKGLADGQELQLAKEAVAEADAPLSPREEKVVLPDAYPRLFSNMNPLPWKFDSELGSGRCLYQGRDYFTGHPVTRLWFKVPAGRRRISVEIGLLPEAYADSLPFKDRTDGIELAIYDEPPGDASRVLLSQLLNPRDRPEDRTFRQFECTADFAADTVVEIAVLPGPAGKLTRDWTLMGTVEIK